MEYSASFALLLVALMVVGLHAQLGQANQLKAHFYKKSCPRGVDVEEIVKRVVWANVATNPKLPAKLLRMFFHDCFVNGCDGSVLLNSTANNTAEKDTIPNSTLRGFDVIDQAKAELEKACPGTVSCADIVALAARDAVSFQFKERKWQVKLGRKDGRVSLAVDALANIPSPFADFATLVGNFAANGLSVQDLVVLSGAHTIGEGHCFIIRNRLYNFTGKGDSDPALDPSYVTILKAKCSPTDLTSAIDMDPGSALSFDNHYYAILKQRRGLFQSDAVLLTNSRARNLVEKLFSNEDNFFNAFKNSITRMGNIAPPAGSVLEIRRNCGRVN